MKAKAKKQYSIPTLEFRIRELHDELNEAIEKHVDQIAAASPGVPRGVCENLEFARATGGRCVCQIYRSIQDGE